MNATRLKNAGRRVLVLVAALAVLGLPAASAQAVTVKALGIIGKNDNSGIDKRIPASLVEYLKRNFKYNSYALGGQDSGTAAVGQTISLSLAGGYSLKVKPTAVQGDKVDLDLSLEKGGESILRNAVSLRKNVYWVWTGGPPVDGGDLIVALAVSD